MTPRLFSLVAVFLSVACLSLAQSHSLPPLGATDAQAAQLVGPVRSVAMRSWRVDFSRHTIQKADMTARRVTSFSRAGAVVSIVTMDSEGVTQSKTLLGYDYMSNLSTAMTVDKSGATVFSSTYRLNLLGLGQDSVSLVDVAGNVVCRSSVVRLPQSVSTSDCYADGAVSSNLREFDSLFRLKSLSSPTDGTTTSFSFRLPKSGVLPVSATRRDPDGSRHNVSFVYEADAAGNWTRRVLSVDGVPVEVAERDIDYYDD